MHKGKLTFNDLHNSLRRGDIVGAVGYPGKSKTDEFTLFANDMKLLTPCLHMLPSLETGLKN